MINELTTDRAALFQGDAANVGEILEPNSIDAIVTDPPAGIGFMGREWDSDKGGRDAWIAWLAGVMREALRVLKPGGHALVWALPRTSHWTATALEDAGFEVRDVVMHLFGTGFPKSLNVSREIDKLDARDERRRRDLLFTAWMRTTGITAAQINSATGSRMGGHYLTDGEQPCVPTEDMFSKLRPLLPAVPAWVETLVAERTVESENFKRRPVVGRHESPTPGFTGHRFEAHNDLITAPATSLAQQWDGWGTALKPAAEHWILVRKPLAGTVAQNVARYSTGALNVDACRIEDDGKGRWPTNVALDEDAAEVLGEPSRFFYVAKPSTSERDAGLEHLPVHSGAEMTDREEGSRGLSNPRAGAGRGGGRRNTHPTVKSIALMRWLCRLITPPGGCVLDLFAGSGSTGVAALAEGLEFVGIEREPEYLAIAKARLEHALRAAPTSHAA